MKIKRKVHINKKTGQMMVTLPKKKLDFLKGKKPKEVTLEVTKGDFKW